MNGLAAHHSKGMLEASPPQATSLAPDATPLATCLAPTPLAILPCLWERANTMAAQGVQTMHDQRRKWNLITEQ